MEAEESPGASRSAPARRLQPRARVRPARGAPRPPHRAAPRQRRGRRAAARAARPSTGRLHYDDLAYYAWLLLDGSAHAPPALASQVPGDPARRVPGHLAAAGGDRRPARGTTAPGSTRSPIRCSRSTSGATRPSGAWKSSARSGPVRAPAAYASPLPATARRCRRGCSRHATCSWTTRRRDGGRPPEVQVTRYDPTQPERARSGAPRRASYGNSTIRSRGHSATARRRRSRCSPADASSSACLSATSTKNFRCGRLRAGDDALDFALEWVDGYTPAVTDRAPRPAAAAARARRRAATPAPRPRRASRPGTGSTQRDSVEPRARWPRGSPRSLRRCESLVASFRAAQELIRLACHSRTAARSTGTRCTRCGTCCRSRAAAPTTMRADEQGARSPGALPLGRRTAAAGCTCSPATRARARSSTS